MDLHYSVNAKDALVEAGLIASKGHSEFITPEHFMRALMDQDGFRELFGRAHKDLKEACDGLDDYLARNTAVTSSTKAPAASTQMRSVMEIAFEAVTAAGKDEVDVPHLVYGILKQDDSFARACLTDSLGLVEAEVLSELFNIYSSLKTKSSQRSSKKDETWKQYCHYIDPELGRNVIGRQAEVERAITIMCCMDANNSLLVGDPGVGKTVTAYAVAARIASGNVPDRLQCFKVLSVDIPKLQDGTQLRTDVEDRLRKVLAEVAQLGDTVLFIDDIQDILGGTLLLSCLGDERIPVIATTTFEDYKKCIQNNRVLSRMFQRIDIEEPTEEEAVKILEGRKDVYGDYHSVKWEAGVIKHAVERSVRYMPSQRLPEKAVSLIDAAGAWREMHPDRSRKVTCQLIDEVLGRMCGVTVEGSDLDGLKDRLIGRVFGQDAAVEQVCDAVFMSKAGLADPLKPAASLLFVGPTGVGKTQLAKELAEGLGVPLQRFDMSEYSEKHTVSKLIGAPAGYVGYEEGGILTDAVRKNPRCVLLLDEMEKAHPDIFNLLLQVMDYGTLSDAKGQKADFRNVVLIMTSNAGARFASRPSIGYGAVPDAGAVMSKEVRNVFAPEFINRLTATVVFNSMSRDMAGLIADAKLRDLLTLLSSKGISLEITPAARELVIDLGYSPEYGAREVDRVVTSKVKPLLVQQILFGALKNGGRAVLDVSDWEFKLLNINNKK